jgi:hypothetical protein
MQLVSVRFAHIRKLAKRRVSGKASKRCFGLFSGKKPDFPAIFQRPNLTMREKMGQIFPQALISKELKTRGKETEKSTPGGGYVFRGKTGDKPNK